MNTNSALSGKNAVITGGSDGIGYGIAEEFARQGANLFLIARTPTKLAEASARLSEYPVTVHTFAADLTDISEVHRAAEHALDIWEVLMCWSIMPVLHGLFPLSKPMRTLLTSILISTSKPRISWHKSYCLNSLKILAILLTFRHIFRGECFPGALRRSIP